MVAVCDFVLTGEATHIDTLQEIDSYLLDLARPDIFDDGDPRNVVVEKQQRFGKLCAALADQGFPRAGELTLFDFHSAIDYLIEKNKTD